MCGVASRRKAETFIADGRVSVNGQTVVEQGIVIDPDVDVVCMDNERVTIHQKSITIRLYKPGGYVCSRNGQGAPTVFDLVKEVDQGLLCAGRLDKDSEGLVILSNDGNLVNRLTHPRFGKEKKYLVTISGFVTENCINKLRQSMDIDGYKTVPAKVTFYKKDNTGNTVLEFVLREGRNRQIRNMCRQNGLKIIRLIRTDIGNWSYQGLKSGEWREIKNNP